METSAGSAQNLSPDARHLEHAELRGRNGELYTHSCDITALLGIQDVTVRHEILRAGHRASAPHAHSHLTEMIFVLEGEIIAVGPGQETRLGAGQFTAFHPGPTRFHHLENRSTNEARFLVISRFTAEDRIIYGEDAPSN